MGLNVEEMLKNPEQRTPVILMGVIIVLIVILVFFSMGRAQKKKKLSLLVPVPATLVNVPSVEIVFSPDDEKKQAAQEALLKQPWGRNPFSEADSESRNEEKAAVNFASGLEAFNLTGILIREGKKTVIINRQFLQEGDELQGYVIKQIQKDRVFMERDGDEEILRMRTA